MKTSKLVMLGVVTCGMVCWAVVQSYLFRRAPEPPQSFMLMQGLKAEQIHRITIEDAETSVTLRRSDKESGAFCVEEMDGYPAKAGAVNALIASCAAVRTSELVTSRRENHASLCLACDESNKPSGREVAATEPAAVSMPAVSTQPDDAAARRKKQEKYQAFGTVVRFYDADDKLITALAVGKPVPAKSSNKQDQELEYRYVRRLPGDDVYIAQDVPNLLAVPLYYVEQRIMDLRLPSTPQNDKNKDNPVLESVRAEDASGEYTLLFNNPAAEVVLDGAVPAGKQLNIARARYVGVRMTDMSFEHVCRDADRNDAGQGRVDADDKKGKSFVSGLNFRRKVAAMTTGGTVYVISLARQDGKCYARLDVGMDPKKAEVMDPNRVGSAAEKGRELVLRDASHAQEFVQKHSGWVYEISDYQAEDVEASLASLLEDVPAAPASQPAESSASEPAGVPVMSAPVSQPASQPAEPAFQQSAASPAAG